MDNKISRATMPNSQRAKIFQPFDALKGLKEAIAAKEYVSEKRRILSEERIQEISHTLSSLSKGNLITVVYYAEREQNYMQLTGQVVKVDPYRKCLLVGKQQVRFCEIFDIIQIDTNKNSPQA